MSVSAEEFGGNTLGFIPEVKMMFDEVKQLQHVTDNFVKTTNVLKNDAVKAIARVNKQPANQFHRRVLIKTLFAWFEGQGFLMKQVALHRFAHLHIDFSKAEIAMMMEDKYSLDEKGEAHASSTNYPRFIPNYQFAFKCFAKAHAITFTFDRSRMPDLKKAEDVRNRLTHPKTLTDLTVLDHEVKLAETVLNSHVRLTADVVGEALKQNPQEVRVAEFRGNLPFQVTLPILVLWSDGNAFEFPSKSAARRFTNARGASKKKLDFTSYSMLEMSN